MTEIPPHLLQRSRERREALGLSTGGSADAGDTSSPAAPAATSPAAAPAAAAPAAPAAPAPPPIPIEDTPAYKARQALKKGRVPLWALPALAALPVWALFYAGTFGERAAHSEGPVDPLVLGAEIYKAQACAGCHGSNGEGGVGPALAGGEAVKTFPDEADHESWIRTGSAGFKGQPYGDPDREGGQRGPATGGMPAYPQLSDEELEAVVKYEREKL